MSPGFLFLTAFKMLTALSTSCKGRQNAQFPSQKIPHGVEISLQHLSGVYEVPAGSRDMGQVAVAGCDGQISDEAVNS